MIKPRALVLTGYGINCDEETQFAFEKAGARVESVHVNDLIDGHRTLQDYQILVFPGGFSYGDDLGAGNALANRVRNHLWADLKKFAESDKLALGICNGFQVMVNLGLVPAIGGEYGNVQAALIHNDIPRYLDRWVDLGFEGKSVWTGGMGSASLPIAHGEGKFYMEMDRLGEVNRRNQVAARYISGEVCDYEGLNGNPNGSLENIAAISDGSGRIIGMMPHPERAIAFTQLPYWPLRKEELKRAGQEIPKEGPGMQIFRNGVNYFE